MNRALHEDKEKKRKKKEKRKEKERKGKERKGKKRKKLVLDEGGYSSRE